MLLPAQFDPAIQSTLAEELAEVKSRFAAELRSDLACVNQLAEHIEQFRGKMLRPTLVLASGLAFQDTLTDAHRVVATVMEMVHMATLVHDDVLDEASTRRRGQTVNFLSGNEMAVMLGDYLISHAYHLCASLGNQEISRTVAATTNTVCEGELLQLANRGNWNLDETTYFDIIRRKTASLCGTCCQLGAMFSGADEVQRQALYTYGDSVGLAFQIIDDVLDLVGTEAAVGKTLGRDLDKGKMTLPLIHCLSHGNREIQQELRELLMARAAGESRPTARILDLARSTNSVAYARDAGARLIAEAKAALDAIPDSHVRSVLLELADAVLTRKA